MNEVGIP